MAGSKKRVNKFSRLPRRRMSKKTVKKEPKGAKKELGEQRSHGVAIHFDDVAKGVVIRGVNKPNNDTVEVYVGNIPIEIDLVQFYKLIDKLSDGECNHIRLACCRGFRKYGFAAISAKKASATVKKIHGKQLLSRKLKSYLALRVLPSNASSSY